MARGKYRRRRERRQLLMGTSLENMGLPMRTVNALEQSGLRTAMDLVGKTEAELLSIPGIGPKTVEAILNAMSKVETEGGKLNEKEGQQT